MIELIGAPFDLCGHTPGSRLGPSALRFANLVETLKEADPDLIDGGDIVAAQDSGVSDSVKHFNPFLTTAKTLKARVAASLGSAKVPVVLGGDHSMAMATVSAALEEHGERLAVLWIDAHTDLNTPDTSPSGNLHGMSLAGLMGERVTAKHPAEGQWNEILEFLGPKRLLASQTAWFGLRDVDSGERARVRKFSRSLPITMHDVDRNSVVAEIRRFHDWMLANRAECLWISFDVDSLDPILAPGTGTAVRGGLTYREGHLVAELLSEYLRGPQCPYRLVGVDLVETNPLCDSNNETAKVAVEWLASLFGKTILGPR